MQTENLFLRKVLSSDMDMLFQLANDETVRSNAFHTSPISYDEHREWFRNVLEDSSQLQFILMSENQPVGQIRLTVDGNQAEIAYSIIPEEGTRLWESNFAADKGSCSGGVSIHTKTDRKSKTLKCVLHLLFRGEWLP